MTRNQPRRGTQSGFFSFDRLVSYHSLVVIFFGISALGLFYLYNAYRRPNDGLAAPAIGVQSAVVEQAVQPESNVLQRINQSTGPTRIGIISGHLNSDSGAVCEDGLQEVDVNYGIANRVVEILRAKNFEVDLLGENDARLDGYTANAMISIHADSCVGAGSQLTGYKTAAPANESSIRLQGCINERYKKTQLPYNANTVTGDMIEYHAFNKINSATPALIIETGFMNLDRPLLKDTPEIPAEAIVEGLLCFLEQIQ